MKTEKTCILLVDGDLASAAALTVRGYNVISVASARQCLESLGRNRIDLIVTEASLPDGDGFALCREIQASRDLPVLFLSARGADADVLAGLRAGGSDYVCKPCDADVLAARVGARLRERRRFNRCVRFGALEMDGFTGTAEVDGRELQLTPKEFSILLFLARSAGGIVDSDRLYRDIWGRPMNGDGTALWSTLSRLKRKLHAAADEIRIVSVRSKGYRLRRSCRAEFGIPELRDEHSTQKTVIN